MKLDVEIPVPTVLVGMYFVQDSRCYTGNAMRWWRERGMGYSSNILDAGLFTKEEAERMQQSRDTDIPWNAAYILRHTQLTVDHQYVNKRLSGVPIHG